ncbi:tetratricopeptide repeat-containing sensor histidine kinase [Spirosoma aerophilum]
MLRFVLIGLLCCLTISAIQAQSIVARDSLLRKLNALPVTANDTTRVNVLNALAFEYRLIKPDTTYLLAQQAYVVAQRLNYSAGQARGLIVMSSAFSQLGDYAKSLKMLNQAKQLFIKLKKLSKVVVVLNNTAYVYMLQGEWQKGLSRIQECYALYKTIPQPDLGLKPTILANIGECFYQLNQLDSASVYLNQALPLAKIDQPTLYGRIFYLLGNVALAKDNTNQAYSFYQQSIGVLSKENSYTRLNEAYYQLATFYQKTDQKDSILHYAKLSLLYGQKSASPKGILKSSQFLTKLYKGKDDTEALRYYEIAVAAKDSLYSQDKMKQLISLTFEEKQHAQEIEAAKAEYRSTVRANIFIGLLVVLGIVALVLYRNNRHKQKANTLLERQRDEIHQQRTQLQESLETLKSTQTQLIQKEKMASLGELTAGIAHEIQNPLNFVNNFSEVSAELVTELAEEQHKLDRDTELEAEILIDLKQNLQKITHHGGRASAIVRGMVEHSRNTTGEKRPTDLNALADEYFQIAYHGLRAKDKSFNAEQKTNFTADLGRIEVVPQEIGRVLLNLYNNAFYAVSEKQKLAPSGYQPTVTVSTHHTNGQLQIWVSDNGTGMPELVKAKIFQPFFTTKPTGEGTGLGLSLSYDIITKGHGGSLRVESQEGQGSTFVIQLPALS